MEFQDRDEDLECHNFKINYKESLVEVNMIQSVSIFGFGSFFDSKGSEVIAQTNE